MDINKNKLTVPIYLNTKIVFDMLATIEDGFSEVKNIQISKSKDKEDEVNANIGTTNLFALLSVGLKGNKKNSRKRDEVVSEERTHTTVSLFQKLKMRLEDNHFIKRDIDEIDVGDFIELQGTFRTNPLIDMLTSFKEAITFSELFSESKNGGKTKVQKMMENKKLETQIDGLIKGLQNEGKKDIICEATQVKVILPTDENYFLNNNMGVITDGDYKVLGKVIKVCKESGEISLLRNTFFSRFKLDKLSDFQSLFNDPAVSPYVRSDEIVTTIKAPVIMMIPIAIYI